MRKKHLGIAFILLLFLVLLSYKVLLSINLIPNTQLPANLPHSLSEETPKFDHIVIILMENRSYSRIVDNNTTPYINSLIDKYSLAQNYFAVSHPSQPNYVALIAGSTFGIKTNCHTCYIDGENLTDQLDLQHKTWKAYMESMPHTCFIGNSQLYVERHNPFIFFNDIRRDPARCKNIVPYTQLKTDLSKSATTPNFIWISPNLCHDMHDCAASIGDKWLSGEIPRLLNSPAFTKQNSLLVITWDEGNKLLSNRVTTVFVGHDVKKNYTSIKYYNHYSLLHTIETLWNMPAITKDVKNTNTMMEFFKKQ